MPALHRISLAAVLTAALSGCYTYNPHRVEFPVATGADCASGKLIRPCADPERLARETTPEYELFYVEFTDQGWSHTTDPRQLEYLTAELWKLVDKQDGGYDGVNIVLFAHGWKHNAKAGDENIEEFKKALVGVSHVEAAKVLKLKSLGQAQAKPRRVVGVYLGWRGRSLVFGDPILSATFWERKTAATDVSVGASRELFARLRVLRETAGRRTVGGSEYAVRFLIVGHSFGGLIVYSATSSNLISDLVSFQERQQGRDAPWPREGDMILVLNPAFEASRFEPLHRLAESTKPERYETPLFVSVTTTADWATRIAFPLGRLFNTFFEAEDTQDEQDADLHTLGHMPAFITHKLTTLGRFRKLQQSDKPEDQKWKSVKIPDTGCEEPLPDDATEEQRLARLAKELEATQAFFCLDGKCAPRKLLLEKNWVRFFCSGTVLMHVGENPNTLVWNVQTDDTVMSGHNDITKPQLVDFVRQLYNDAPILAQYQNLRPQAQAR
ncbi:MAG TPA: hypothetical protein VFB08_19100 [Burkholderiales bacterium]|nr:hypothetical protein [Burkholderiales bacterium]